MIGLGLSLTTRAVLGLSFNPATLFAAGEQGILIDPSDLSTLFTDTAGTTPVTAPGQTVALALDKSRGLVLGPELVTNGDFSSSDGWTIAGGSGWAITGGAAIATNLVISNPSLSRASVFPAGRFVRYSFTVSSYVSGSIFLRCYGSGGNEIIASASANGTYTGLYFTRTDATGLLGFSSTAGATLTVDNISVRELPGNHLTQPVAAARPIYGRHPAGGIRNRQAATEDFANASLYQTIQITVSANVIASPDSALTADKLVENTASAIHRLQITNVVPVVSGVTYSASIYAKDAGRRYLNLNFNTAFAARSTFDLVSGVVSATSSGSASIASVGDGWFRCTVTGVAPTTQTTSAFLQLNNSGLSADTSYTGDGTSGIFIWGAQLEVGSTATPYQRAGAPSGLAFPQPQSYDITEAGQASLHYLFCDGLARWMVSPTITPGTDKVQVFAGARKLSDAAAGTVAELSTNIAATSGALVLFAPATPAANLQFQSKGTASSGALASGISAPVSVVASAIGDIAADTCQLRVNGALAASGVLDQGVGNYLANPLYIGSRAGTSLFLNGLIYSLVVRFGPNLPLATIQQVERWTAQRSGVTLP